MNNNNVYNLCYIQCHISSEVICVKIVKSMALIAVGAGAVLAYQKYSEPMMDKISQMADDTMKKASKKLEDMMD